MALDKSQEDALTLDYVDARASILDMSQEDVLTLLRSGQPGIRQWNRLRHEPPSGLRGLVDFYSHKPDLRGADLKDQDLLEADFTSVQLSGANLRNAILTGANLALADLSNADLSEAEVDGANLSGTNLQGADVRGANFLGAILRFADLKGARFDNARFAGTLFASDLSGVIGLESTLHLGPSYIDIGSLLNTKTLLPEEFLRGCGVREEEIEYLKSVIAVQAKFFSCFISYSTKDEEFARRLYSRMRAENLRVWFAPEDMKGGEKLYQQVEHAIQMHDRLLLVLSENSMQSEWVMTEMRNARRIEIREKRRKLFPIRLVDFETIGKWQCFDADTGKDLAVELREYLIPDFSSWKNQNSFEKAFARLLRDLKALN